jgi:hypothetical protein
METGMIHVICNCGATTTAFESSDIMDGYLTVKLTLNEGWRFVTNVIGPEMFDNGLVRGVCPECLKAS